MSGKPIRGGVPLPPADKSPLSLDYVPKAWLDEKGKVVVNDTPERCVAFMLGGNRSGMQFPFGEVTADILDEWGLRWLFMRRRGMSFESIIRRDKVNVGHRTAKESRVLVAKAIKRLTERLIKIHGSVEQGLASMRGELVFDTAILRSEDHQGTPEGVGYLSAAVKALAVTARIDQVVTQSTTKTTNNVKLTVNHAEVTTKAGDQLAEWRNQQLRQIGQSSSPSAPPTPDISSTPTE